MKKITLVTLLFVSIGITLFGQNNDLIQVDCNAVLIKTKYVSTTETKFIENLQSFSEEYISKHRQFGLDMSLGIILPPPAPPLPLDLGLNGNYSKDDITHIVNDFKKSTNYNFNQTITIEHVPEYNTKAWENCVLEKLKNSRVNLIVHPYSLEGNLFTVSIGVPQLAKDATILSVYIQNGKEITDYTNEFKNKKIKENSSFKKVFTIKNPDDDIIFSLCTKEYPLPVRISKLRPRNNNINISKCQRWK
ncbi:MAG: hypothetical protein IPP34_18175 [Bacteroidetes bacterium]|nr:hypothetical protein [Bacteroidota bacterium]